MSQQQLSSKEQGLFRTLVKFFEAKQHKKALKTAEQILKKNPDHADTIAMKACFTFSYALRRLIDFIRLLPSMRKAKEMKPSIWQERPCTKT
jgi:hypothetical protein